MSIVGPANEQSNKSFTNETDNVQLNNTSNSTLPKDQENDNFVESLSLTSKISYIIIAKIFHLSACSNQIFYATA